jgi:hypothetical protein
MTPLGPTHLIVKDCWVDHEDGSDSFIHELLKARNKEHCENQGEQDAAYQEPHGIAIYSAGQVDTVMVPLTNNLHHDQADKNSQYFKDNVVQHVAMRQMIHKRFVFNTCGVALPIR